MLTLRRAELDDIPRMARLEHDTHRAAYRGMIPDVWIDSRVVAEYAAPWAPQLADPSLRVFVAEDASGRLLGFARSGPDRKGLGDGSGEFQKIYAAADQRRRGTGRALMAAMAAHLAEVGYQTVRVWVMEANRPAQAFYERLGGQHDQGRMHPEDIGPGFEPLPHRAYLWHDPGSWARSWNAH